MCKVTFDRNVLSNKSKFMWRKHVLVLKVITKILEVEVLRLRMTTISGLVSRWKFSRRIVWLIKKGPVIVKI